MISAPEKESPNVSALTGFAPLYPRRFHPDEVMGVCAIGMPIVPKVVREFIWTKNHSPFSIGKSLKGVHMI